MLALSLCYPYLYLTEVVSPEIWQIWWQYVGLYVCGGGIKKGS